MAVSQFCFSGSLRIALLVACVWLLLTYYSKTHIFHCRFAIWNMKHASYFPNMESHNALCCAQITRHSLYLKVPLNPFFRGTISHPQTNWRDPKWLQIDVERLRYWKWLKGDIIVFCSQFKDCRSSENEHACSVNVPPNVPYLSEGFGELAPSVP